MYEDHIFKKKQDWQITYLKLKNVLFNEVNIYCV